MSDLAEVNSIQKFMLHDRGIINANETEGAVKAEWCYSNNINLNESWVPAWISITATGQLVANSAEVMVDSLQSAAVQLVPAKAPPIISITPYNGSTKRTYIKVEDEYSFDRVLANLIIWTSLKPQGLAKKWSYKKSIVEDDKVYGNELLVCRFKVYGPIPPKVKSLKTVQGPKVPITNGGNDVTNANEAWFMAMGYLKPNGILDLLLEIDGSLLYSINIAVLFNSEIRQLDHSIFQNSNILYLGIIHELRSLNTVKPVELYTDQTKDFIIPPPHITNKHDLHNYQMTSRVLLEFPLHIDLEDWFVTLSSFTKREYIVDRRSLRKPRQLRSIQKIQLDIVEAKFDDDNLYHKKRLYTELILWNHPWSRTAVVETYHDNAFWRENFQFELPISTHYFQLVVRQSLQNDEYGLTDPVIGTIYVTPDMLDPLKSKDIDRLTVYDSKNMSIGKIFINLTQQQHYILPAEEYRVFEKMVVSIPFEELIEFVKPLASTAAKLEEYSAMLVDIFQALHKENEWFLALMDHELHPVDSLTRNNRMKGTVNTTKTSNVFNTLFRGNSMLTKSLEKFNFRVGQEYLEKTIGEFVNKISVEAYDCEIDPRLIDIDDEEVKQEVLRDHTTKLLHYVKELWDLIFKTSNDLPTPIKTQLKKFRLKVENSVEPLDTVTPLNCLTAFIFLRFFCPAILNPKLFYLTKNHQTGDVQRTLTLIAKIILTLANRSTFVEHKEPYLLPFNSFVTEHQPQVLEYFDKLSGRRLDFEPKILELSDDVTRPSLNIPQDILEELPTNPYLIDKYLRIEELINLICPAASFSSTSASASASAAAAAATSGHARRRSDTSTASSYEQLYKIHTLDEEEDDTGLFDEFIDDSDTLTPTPVAPTTIPSTTTTHTSDDRNLVQTDQFIKKMLQSSSSNEFDDLVKTHLKLQDLRAQCELVVAKTAKLTRRLTKPESPSSPDWPHFVSTLVQSCVIDISTKQILVLSSPGANFDQTRYRLLSQGGLKTKVSNKGSPLRVGNNMLRSSSMTTLKATESKNPFKKFFGKKYL